MQTEFLEKFSKDLDKIKISHIKDSVRKTILRVEAANSLTEIPHLKKLSGHKSAYRIRVGDYRIGLYLEGNLVQFARIVHRKDIYRIFP